MSFDPITALLDIGKLAIKRKWPDPIEQAKHEYKLIELAQNKDLAALDAEVKLILAQTEINKIEAGHKSLFVAGWRPSVGWVCSISLGLAFVPKTIALTAIWIWQSTVILTAENLDIMEATLPAFPDLGTGDVIALLGALLGMGTLRTLDKKNKTETNSIK